MRTLTLLAALACTTAFAADVTRHRIHGFTAAGGLTLPPTVDLNSTGATWNIVRHFNLGSQPYRALINGHTGRIQLHFLGGGGAPVGAVVEDETWPRLRCTDAQVLGHPLGARLFALDTFHGTLVIYDLSAAGQLLPATEQVVQLPQLKDKNVFDAFQLGGQWRLFGLDTFSGAVAVFDWNGALISSAAWTTGYSTADHVSAAGKTYRIIYKGAGDPTRLASEPGDGAGLLVVQAVAANGMNAGNTQNVTTTAGWSQVRFVTVPGPGGTFTYHVLFHNRETQQYLTRPFDPVTGRVLGLGALPGTTASGGLWSEVEPYVAGGLPWVSLLDADGVTPFGFNQVENMARAVHDRVSTRVAGYQLAIAQSGRVVYLRGWGNVGLGAQSAVMTPRTKMDIGSVSKLVTAVTVAQMSAFGIVNLGLPLSTYLPANTPDGWADEMSLWNAMTMTTGMALEGCEPDVEKLTMNCKPFYEADRTIAAVPNGTATVTDDYPRDYNNSNTAVARDLFKQQFNVEQTTSIPWLTQMLWGHPLGDDMTELSCQHDPSVYYFGPCHGAAGCVSHPNGDSYQQDKIIADWSSNCSAGGWAASSRRLLELLDELRYSRILGNTAAQSLMMSTSQASGGKPTAFGWEPPVPLWGAQLLGKNGANGDDETTAAFSAQVYHLDQNTDAVLMVNTAGGGANVLLDTYIVGRCPTCPVARYMTEDVYPVTGTFSTLAINEVSEELEYGSFEYVTASRNSDGKLQLDAFDVSTGLQSTLTDTVIDEKLSSVAVTDGNVFATAVRNGDGKLQVTWWNSSFGGLYKAGWAVDGEIDDVDVARVSVPTISTQRIAVLSQLPSGDLRLGVMDHDLISKLVTHVDDAFVGQGNDGVVQALVTGDLLAPASRLVLAFRNKNGKLEVQVWDVDAAGLLAKRGGWPVSNVWGGASARSIAIDQKGDGSAFFSGNGFVTTHVDAAGKLEARSWSVNAFGIATEKGVLPYNLAVTSLDTFALTSAVRSSAGDLQLLKWAVAANGTVTMENLTWVGPVNQAVTAGGKVVAYRNSKDELRLSTFKLVK